MGFINSILLVLIPIALSTFAHAENFGALKNNKRASSVYEYTTKGRCNKRVSKPYNLLAKLEGAFLIKICL